MRDATAGWRAFSNALHVIGVDWEEGVVGLCEIVRQSATSFPSKQPSDAFESFARPLFHVANILTDLWVRNTSPNGIGTSWNQSKMCHNLVHS